MIDEDSLFSHYFKGPASSFIKAQVKLCKKIET